MAKPAYPFGKEVILELKFTNHYPDWFRDLVRVFGCMQCGAAKYVEGAENLGFTHLQLQANEGEMPLPVEESLALSTILLPKDPKLGTLSDTATKAD